jgi:hypothetical protein
VLKQRVKIGTTGEFCRMGDQPDRKITALARRNHTAIRQPQRAGRMPRRDMPDDPPKARHKWSPAQSRPSWTVIQQAISSADPVRAPDRTPERSVFAKRQCLAQSVHQKGGAPYANPAELSQRIYAAAVETGSGLTFFAAAGRFGLGSVSNIRNALTEELRTREYSQRLGDLARNVLTREGASVGSMLYLAAAQAGARTLRRDAGASQEAALADLTAIDSRAPAPPVKFQIRLVRKLP